MYLFSAMTGMTLPQILKVLDDAIESVISADTRVKITSSASLVMKAVSWISLYAFQKSSRVLRSTGLRKES
jgi:hypothetical protein